MTNNLSTDRKPTLNGDILKLFYLALLQLLPSQDIRLLFKNFILVFSSKPKDERQFFSDLFDDKLEKIYFDDFIKFLCKIEEHLESKNITKIDLFKAFYGSPPASYWSHYLLKFTGHFLRAFFRNTNIYGSILSLSTWALKRLIPNSYSTFLFDKHIKGNQKYYFLFSPFNAQNEQVGLPTFDPITWFLYPFAQLPHIFNVPAFQKGEVIAWPGLNFDSFTFGRKEYMKFSSFCNLNQIDFDKLKISDKDVIVLYGVKKESWAEIICLDAPVYAIQLIAPSGHQPSNAVLANHFDHLIKNATSSDGLAHKIAPQKHKELLQSISGSLDVQFHRKQEAIFVNGLFLIQGKGAQILKEIIQNYTLTGQINFDRKRFIHNSEIFAEEKNANFDVRLLRLIKAIQTQMLDLRIIKIGRGIYKFETDRVVKFTEKE